MGTVGTLTNGDNMTITDIIIVIVISTISLVILTWIKTRLPTHPQIHDERHQIQRLATLLADMEARNRRLENTINELHAEANRMDAILRETYGGTS